MRLSIAKKLVIIFMNGELFFRVFWMQPHNESAVALRVALRADKRCAKLRGLLA